MQMPEDPKGTRGSSQLNIDALHRDIATGNQYRLELSKTLLTLATGLLAFTFAFPPQLTAISNPEALRIGWSALAVSVLGGCVNLYGWERFYLSYRDWDWKGKGEDGKQARAAITRWRRIGRLAQFLGFVVGVAGVGAFAIANVSNIALKAAN